MFKYILYMRKLRLSLWAIPLYNSPCVKFQLTTFQLGYNFPWCLLNDLVVLKEKPNTFRVPDTTQAHPTIRNVLLGWVLPNLLALLQSLLHTSCKIAGSSWHAEIDDSNWKPAAGELHSQNLHSWRRTIQGQSPRKVKCIWTSFPSTVGSAALGSASKRRRVKLLTSFSLSD